MYQLVSTCTALFSLTDHRWFSFVKTCFMKLIRIVLNTLPFILFSITLFAQTTIPFSDKRWTIKSGGHLVEYYKGYEALYLQNGIAYLPDEQFGNGIIEFDIFLSERVSFSGVIFRMADEANYEELYLRSQLSGFPDAYQYTPVFNNNSGWQLYHDQYNGNNDGFVHFSPRDKGVGYNGILHFSFQDWTHVKLVVKGEQAELYLNHSEKPSAFISKLRRGLQAGYVGVESSVGACWFANFTVTKSNDVQLVNKEIIHRTPDPGTIMQWSVSNAFPENVLKDNSLTNKLNTSLRWIKMIAEESGLVNLSLVSAVTDSTNTVIAKLSITSDKNQLKKLDIGYSDRIKIFCNDQILYSGNTGFRTRDYKYLGTIGYFDAVYLPLKKGENTIMLAVSETFGGWGLQAKIVDMSGINIHD